MVHLRREFTETAEVGVQKQHALRIIRIIGQLYRIERFATNKELSHENRLALRIKYGAKIMKNSRRSFLIRALPCCLQVGSARLLHTH
jgi:Transposase IS66 family